MSLSEIHIGWFDFVTAVTLLVGILRGRARGISQELMDLLQWLAIVTVSASFYGLFGQFFSEYLTLSAASANILAYLVLAVGVKFAFMGMKRVAGEKLVSSDLFGSMEYYLGMGAGAIRFSCVLVLLLALLNAQHISKRELQHQAMVQEKDFGDIRFPTVGSLQQDIFANSYSGKLAKDYLSTLLIETAPETATAPERTTLKNWEQKNLDEVMDTGKKKKR